MKHLWLISLVVLTGCTQQFALFNFPEPSTATPAATTPKAVRNQCRDCATAAMKAESDTYRRAACEIKAAHDKAQKELKARYNACSIAEVVALPETPYVAPASSGELLPETGTVKNVAPYCHDGNCK